MKAYPIPPGGHCLDIAAASPSGDAPCLWIDGTVRKGVAAGGAWARCATTEQEFSWRFSVPTNDSTWAELAALEAALKALPDEALLGAVVYTDSFQLIEHLERFRAGHPNRYPQLPAIQQMLTQRGVSQLRNVERRFNKRADALARQGLPGGR